MSYTKGEIEKLTNVIRNSSNCDYGTLMTLNEIDNIAQANAQLIASAPRLDKENSKLKEDIKLLELFLENTRNDLTNLKIINIDLLEALKLWRLFWDKMPKGQLGKISCDIGILNEAFIKMRQTIAKAEGEK